jgi:hypothetical protein
LYWVGANVSSVNGPVTTGFVSVYLTGSATDDHTCAGTIGTWATWAAKGTFGCLNVTVNVLPAPLTLATCAQMPRVSSAGNFLSRLKVNVTSVTEKA